MEKNLEIFGWTILLLITIYITGHVIWSFGELL